MKKIIIALALAVAAMPLTFAAQTPAKGAPAKPHTAAVRKHRKGARKAAHKTTAQKSAASTVRAK